MGRNEDSQMWKLTVRQSRGNLLLNIRSGGSALFRAMYFLLAASALLVPAAVIISGCSAPADPAEYSVILITLDTTRADRIGAYGGTAVPTPILDRIAAEGVLFEDAISQVPLTLPSHASILTGRYPASHGVRHNGLFQLPQEEETIAERLQENRFETAAFVAASVLNAPFGTSQGFDTYSDMQSGQTPGKDASISADEVNGKVFKWLDERTDEDRFFLWAHYYDPHSPYAAPEQPGRTLAGSGYDREIFYIDACLGDLLDKLESRGILDKTILVVAGDHGESLGEHGEDAHGVFLYEGAIRVPFMMRAPGLIPANRRIQGPVGLVDIAPTLMQAAGLPVPASMQGSSLWPILTGEADPTHHKSHVVCEFNDALGSARIATPSHGSMFFDGRFKHNVYHGTGLGELFDLENDPGEFENLWDDQDGDPTSAFIGCPHNTYHEVVKWGRRITEALDKEGKTEAAIPIYMFMVNKVRDRLIEEEGELAGKMKKAGVHFTNMCTVSYAGMKGVSKRERGVTNSAKTRVYSNFRYFPDEMLVQTIVTGKIQS